jgi:hypothetical protein
MQYSGHFREEPNWESGHFIPPSLFVVPQVLMVFQIGPQFVVLENPPLVYIVQWITTEKKKMMQMDFFFKDALLFDILTYQTNF